MFLMRVSSVLDPAYMLFRNRQYSRFLLLIFHMMKFRLVLVYFHDRRRNLCLVAPTKSSNTCCDNSDAELANVSTWYGLNTSLPVNLCVVTLARAIGFSTLPIKWVETDFTVTE